MRLVSINVGLPREVTWHGKTVLTSIWKEPVSGPVRVSTLNLEGDRQADLSVHGGTDKTVYVYPAEHYSYWHSQLSGAELSWGAFGENFTTEGLLEGTIYIGACDYNMYALTMDGKEKWRFQTKGIIMPANKFTVTVAVEKKPPGRTRYKMAKSKMKKSPHETQCRAAKRLKAGEMMKNK